jgi:hypothetical protein
VDAAIVPLIIYSLLGAECQHRVPYVEKELGGYRKSPTFEAPSPQIIEAMLDRIKRFLACSETILYQDVMELFKRECLKVDFAL